MKVKYFKSSFFVLLILILITVFYFKSKDRLGLAEITETEYSVLENKNEESCLQCHQNTTGYS